MRNWCKYILLCFALFFVGCKTCVPVIEYRDSIRTVEVRTHDTTIVTEADSAQVQLLLRCDSANNVLIDEITTSNGERLQLQAKLKKLLNGYSQLSVDCKEDSLLNIIHWQDSIISTSVNHTIVQERKVVPSFYKGCTVALWILVALLAVGITLRVLIRVYLHK